MLCQLFFVKNRTAKTGYRGGDFFRLIRKFLRIENIGGPIAKRSCEILGTADYLADFYSFIYFSDSGQILVNNRDGKRIPPAIFLPSYKFVIPISAKVDCFGDYLAEPMKIGFCFTFAKAMRDGFIVPKNGKRFRVDINGFKSRFGVGLQDSSGSLFFMFAQTY